MLIECPECHQKVSDHSMQCIHCGYPISKNVKEPEDLTSNEAHQDTANKPEEQQKQIDIDPGNIVIYGLVKSIFKDKKINKTFVTIECKNGYTWMHYGSLEWDEFLQNDFVEFALEDFTKKSVAKLRKPVSDTEVHEEWNRPTGILIQSIDQYLNLLEKSASTGSDTGSESAEKRDNKIPMVPVIIAGIALAFWFAKGFPSPSVWLPSAAKEACLDLAKKNKEVFFGGREVRTHDSWLKDGRRVVQLVWDSGNDLKARICVYGGGMVEIPNMFEQGKWK